MRRGIVIGAIAIVACGSGSDKPAANATSAPTSTVDASVSPPSPTVSGVDTNALAGLLASAAAATMATMQPAGSADPAERGLREAAAKHAAGMTPEGDVAKGTLSEGGHLAFIANLDPSKCYTIVGYGVGVEDLDLYLLVPPFYNLLGAHDVSTGPSAIIGASPKMCPISPIAVPYKIDIHAKKGSGPVAAQIFSKAK